MCILCVIWLKKYVLRSAVARRLSAMGHCPLHCTNLRNFNLMLDNFHIGVESVQTASGNGKINGCVRANYAQLLPARLCDKLTACGCFTPSKS